MSQSQSQSQTRKSHIKSRLGCSACKQRHQKCDESRPSCVNCLTARRHCPYLDQQSDQADSATYNQTSVVEAKTRSSVQSPTSYCQPIQLTLRDVPKDLLHIELLEHWLARTYLTCVGPREAADKFGSIVLNHALNSPFLMQSMLSLAALHKASLASPSDHRYYLEASERLQAEGLVRFNVIVASLSSDTIVPAFLFAFITGIHRLCNVSLQAEATKNLHAILIDAMVFMQGVGIIVSGWWPFLKESELKDLIPDANAALTAGDDTNATEGLSQLRRLLELIDADNEMRDTYTNVVDGLQGLFEQINALTPTESDESIGVVVVWMISMPTQFTSCLKQQRPEALVVLAHAAPLFHYRRNLWCIRDVGKMLVDSISSHLPDPWQEWLQWPKRMVGATERQLEIQMAL